MKKNLIIFMMLSFVLAILSGCGGDSPKAQDGKTVLSGMVQQSRNTKGLQDMITKLEAEENIKIDMQVIPDDQYDNLLTMKINSGEAPDMIDYNLPALYGFLDAPGLLVDLSEESWAPKLINPAISTHNDGNIYAWTYESSNGFHAMMYNKDIFNQVGIKEIPTTVDGFYSLLDQLKGSGIVPIGQPSDTWVPQIYMTSGYARALGSTEAVFDFANKIGSGKAKFTDFPEIVSVVDYYLSFFKRGYMNDDYLTTNIETVQTNMIEGKIGMMMGSSGLYNTLLKNNPDANIGVFNMPTPYDSKDVMSSPILSKGFVIPKSSENIEATKKVFELWSTPEYLDMYFNDFPGYPAYAEINEGDIPEDVINLYKTYTDRDALVMEMNNALTKLKPLYGNLLWIYYIEAYEKGWTGEELLDKFQKDVDIYLKDLEG